MIYCAKGPDGKLIESTAYENKRGKPWDDLYDLLLPEPWARSPTWDNIPMSTFVGRAKRRGYSVVKCKLVEVE